MTTIGLLSDLHLEFGSQPHIKLPETDILILAGDVIEARFLETRMNDATSRGYRRTAQRLCQRIIGMGYKLVVVIGGNHELYGARGYYDAHKILREFYDQFGFIFLENEVYNYNEEIDFIGSTLWSSFNNGDPYSMKVAENYMNDFTQIPEWSADKALAHHKLAASTIEAFLTMGDYKKVVVTHHAPSFKSADPIYENRWRLNGAYMSDLEGLVEHADVWCHGHLHYKSFYKIGKAQVMCNPVGYYPYEGIIADERMNVEL